MESGKDPIPVYRKGPDQRVVKKLENIVKSFAEDMKQQVKKMVMEGSGVPEVPTDADLLGARTSLVRAIEEGMLERKDQEGKIGVIAAMVWFMRQEHDRQRRILEEW